MSFLFSWTILWKKHKSTKEIQESYISEFFDVENSLTNNLGGILEINGEESFLKRCKDIQNSTNIPLNRRVDLANLYGGLER